MSKKVNLAIVGCGSMTYNAHAVWINTVPEIRVTALCDINRAAAEKLRRDRFNDDHHIEIYDDWRQLLEHRPAEPAGVLFVTPHGQHFEQCMAAMRQGWHVLVEKPMVTNSRDARALVHESQESGRQLQVAFQAAFSGQYAHIRELVTSGSLGRVQAAGGFVMQDWQKFTTGTWRQDIAVSGGGFIFDSGAHLLNALNMLIGQPAVEVQAMLNRGEAAVELGGVINVRYRDGVLASAMCCGSTAGWQEGLWLAAERGRVHTGIHGGRLELWNERGEPVERVHIRQPHYTPPQNFALSILGQAEPRSPARLGLLHALLMEAVYRSAADGRNVAVEQE